MTGKRAIEVSGLVAAAQRTSAESPAAQALAHLAAEQWRLARTLRGCPGRQWTALLHAESYARAAFQAGAVAEELVVVPQD